MIDIYEGKTAVCMCTGWSQPRGSVAVGGKKIKSCTKYVLYDPPVPDIVLKSL